MCFHSSICFFSWSYGFCHGIKIYVITAGIKKCKSINKKNKKKHCKILLLAKSKLNNMEDLTFKALIGSNISYYEFILINNVLKESKILITNKILNYI